MWKWCEACIFCVSCSPRLTAKFSRVRNISHPLSSKHVLLMTVVTPGAESLGLLSSLQGPLWQGNCPFLADSCHLHKCKPASLRWQILAFSLELSASASLKESYPLPSFCPLSSQAALITLSASRDQTWRTDEGNWLAGQR